jgi:hypothetical protein
MNRSGWRRLLLVLFLGAKTNRFAAISAPNITEQSKNPLAPRVPFPAALTRN